MFASILQNEKVLLDLNDEK